LLLGLLGDCGEVEGGWLMSGRCEVEGLEMESVFPCNREEGKVVAQDTKSLVVILPLIV
jgi:hypothetical protein